MVLTARPLSVAVLVAAALAASCSTTRVEGTWIDAAFNGQRLLGPVLVVGIMRDEGTSAQLMEAARSAGARYAMSTAVLAKSERTVLYSDGGPVFLGAGYGGWYGTYWGAALPVTTTVRQYEVYACETAIFDVATDRIQWTARSRSAATSELRRDVRDFASAIVEAMAKAGLLEAAPSSARRD